ncbi:hypothetical protein ACKERC_02670 [Acinetobacter baumannii]|uniref:hypothetical protein n=1 Tax=Acinetobacter baumannii TaxID=470 RepID=UPI0038B513DB
MKPEQFIREYGVEKAREVVEVAPELSLFYDLEKQKHVLKESTSIAMAFLKNRFLPIEDLKRLVESVELVEKFGSLIAAKAYVPDGYKSDRLKQAIRDHESIYGGGDE